jgi:hypothetical protein
VTVRTVFTPILKAKETKYREGNKQAARQEIKDGEESKA